MRGMRAADGAAVYLKSILFNLVVQFIAGIAILIVTAKSESAANALSYAFMLLIQGSFFLALFTTVKGKKRKPAYGFKRVGALTVIISVALALVSVVCFSLPAQWFSFLLDKIGYVGSELVLDGWVEILLMVVAAGFAAPVMEELVFRGALTGGLMKKTKPHLAIIIGAACFSLMHMNPEQTVYQFLLGCVAGSVAYCSGSVIPAITVHFVNNATALALSFVPGEGAALTPSIPLLIITLVAFCLGTVALIFGSRLIMKREKGNETLATLMAEESEDIALDEENGSGALLGKRSHIITVCIGLGVCTLMWLITLGAALLVG